MDLEINTWMEIITTGDKPSPRQGPAAVKHGNYLYITAGCDFRLKICFNDTFKLDTDKLIWHQVINSQKYKIYY